MMSEYAVSSYPIPKIIHQTWKDHRIPRRFVRCVESVKRYHPGWEYRFWTDEDIDNWVREEFPEFYEIFSGFSRHIMRVDVFRYLLMKRIGGVYADLDYEFLRPYDYRSKAGLILSLERDKSYGDSFDSVANYLIASRPNHPFWNHLYQTMMLSPPKTDTYTDVLISTGPGFLSQNFFELQEIHDWHDVLLTPRPVFSPHRLHSKSERKLMLNSGLTVGYHLGAGSWKERWTIHYLKTKLIRSFTRSARHPQRTA